MRHRDKHKILLLCSVWRKKIRTNRTYIHESQYTKHGFGYRDFVYYK